MPLHPLLKLIIVRWRELLILLLLAIVSWEAQQNEILRRAQADTQESSQTKVIYGPTRTVTKYIQVEGKPQIIERIVERESETREKQSESSSQAACPAFPKRYAGAIWGPGTILYGGQVGMTVSRFDVSVGALRTPRHGEIIGFLATSARF